MRKTILAKKIGMTRIYTEDGKAIAVTVLDVSNNVISKHVKSVKGGNVTHVEIGKDKKKNANKVELGNYKESQSVPRFKLVVKLAENEEPLALSSEVKPSVFEVGEKVDIITYTKGKGFQGVVKRWGFSGGPRTHGASDRERAPGSIGARMTPGRVIKGMKMGGHMGNVKSTIKGLKVVSVMEEDGLIAVSGSVQGFKGSYLVLRSAKK